MLSREQARLDEAGIVFEPGLNEDLAATAVWGTQQVNLFPGAQCEGVFGMWYGKAPGLDRSGDVFRHANAAGSSPRGGVVAVVGDDPGCKSSTLPSASAGTLRDLRIPILVPGDLEDLIDLGHFGWGLSRYSGLWSGMLAVTAVMDSSGTVSIDPDRHQFVWPEHDFDPHIRLPDPPNDQEARYPLKLNLAAAFATANQINKLISDPKPPILTLFATGKTCTDMREALALIGFASPDSLEKAGIRVVKMGMIWPLDPEFVRARTRGSSAIVVVENKSGFLERQLKTTLYGSQAIPILGKRDQSGAPLFNLVGELPTSDIAIALSRVFNTYGITVPNRNYVEYVLKRRQEADAEIQPANVARQPLYCAGCPHSRSTKVPEGSRALAGIGCHYMVQWMDRNTSTFTQMGGEGVTWIGQAPFTDEEHVFVNLGDGTYFHSGVLAIRAAVAAGVNVTFKLLFNDAVAMTGGQAVEGGLTVEDVVAQVKAENVADVRVVSASPERFRSAPFDVMDRKELDAVSKSLATVKGCTVLIYDQPCANELRRRRKRKLVPQPVSRVFINEEVCEGCGDCTAVSNCVAIEPLETKLGVKRKINQTSCNQDLTCVEGFCPSFVEISGKLRKADTNMPDIGDIADPEQASDSANILITGVGGTGIVTLSQVLSVAAHIEGRHATNLDMTGLAQKGGAVFAHVRVSNQTLNRTSIPEGTADVLIAADLVTATARETRALVNPEKTLAIANAHVSPTSAFVLRGEAMTATSRLLSRLEESVQAAHAIDGDRRVREALGTTTYANVFLLGYAFQKGLIPLACESIEEALRLNGVAIEQNINAFRLGRMVCVDPGLTTSGKVEGLQPAQAGIHGNLDDMIEFRAKHLEEYQNEKLARTYRLRLKQVRETERAAGGRGERLTRTVAEAYFKLLAAKDEYEVARLLSSPKFADRIRERYEAGYRMHFHLGPTWLTGGDRSKRKFGPWMYGVFRLLAAMKVLRGTVFDVFRFNVDRRFEIRLRNRFLDVLDAALATATPASLPLLEEWAGHYVEVKGFGHIKEQSWERVREREEALARLLMKDSGIDDDLGESSHRKAA